MKNFLKLSWRSELPSIILLILAVILSFYFYFNFPEQVATHWNIEGQPDDYSSKGFAAFFFPGLMVGIYILMLSFPYLDPKKDRYAQFTKVYGIVRFSLIALLFAIYGITGLNGIGYAVSVGTAIPILIGFLFIVIGNYMGKIKSNWFFGIRNPWTLSSDQVWNKTHRLGGKIFILAGLLMISEPFLPISWRLPVFVIAIGGILIGTNGYSYYLFYKEKKGK